MHGSCRIYKYLKLSEFLPGFYFSEEKKKGRSFPQRWWLPLRRWWLPLRRWRKACLLLRSIRLREAGHQTIASHLLRHGSRLTSSLKWASQQGQGSLPMALISQLTLRLEAPQRSRKSTQSRGHLLQRESAKHLSPSHRLTSTYGCQWGGLCQSASMQEM